VRFAFASFDNSFARRLGQNAANAVAHGLPYDEALRAVTVYPARIFGLDNQLEQSSRAKLPTSSSQWRSARADDDVRYLFIHGQLTSTTIGTSHV